MWPLTNRTSRPVSSSENLNTMGGVGIVQWGSEVNADLDALAAKVGNNSSADTASLDYKVAQNTTNISANSSNILDLQNGWTSAGETWTYASATTFTIPGDKTGKYQIGDKIKLTQSTAKYFHITAVSYSSPNTTITIFAGSDYTLANTAITNPYYSRQYSPFGFPREFNYTPDVYNSAGLSTLGTGATIRGVYTRLGARVIGEITLILGTSPNLGSGDNVFTLPVTPRPSISGQRWRSVGTAFMEDYGVKGYTGWTRLGPSDLGTAYYRNRLVVEYANPASAGSTLIFNPTQPFTWAAGDYISVTFDYETDI